MKAYFNDDVYIGSVRTGEVVEVSVADPALETVFYSMEQGPGDHPRFERRTENCLLCHGGSQTRGVPGHIVRSALHREAALNRNLKQPPDYRWPSTNTVLDGAAKALVECFLFCDEAPLAGPIEGPTTGGRSARSSSPRSPTRSPTGPRPTDPLETARLKPRRGGAPVERCGISPGGAVR